MALVDESIAALQRFRNVVLEGPPGTGKTYVVGDIAEQWSASTGRPLGGNGTGSHAITMHPSTSYEDFVEGLRYDEHSKSFRVLDGFMTRVVTQALRRPDQDFLILLDELNRANVPKVLGDLLLTLEASKRHRWDSSGWSGGATVTLPCSGRLFGVPDNIFVLATMNTTDRSIAPLDAALRRRFAFVRVSPLRSARLTAAVAATRGAEFATFASTTTAMLDRLNVSVLRPVLGPDGELGHSYVFDMRLPVDEDLATALQPASSGVTRAFWFETRGKSGGSGTQLDLAETGASGVGGSLELFYPLTTSSGVESTSDPQRSREDRFVVRFSGSRYEGNRLFWKSQTPGWKIQLEGKTADNESFSTVLGRRDPVGADPDALVLEHRILVWFVRPDGELILERVEATPERLAAMKQLSAWSDRSQSGARGRDHGLLELQRVQEQLAVDCHEPRLTWRYAVLPQLVELAVVNGVEDLFDPTRRVSWQATHGAPADDSTLADFDEFLRDMSIWLRVVGSGLGRTLLILDEPQMPVPTPAPAAGLGNAAGGSAAPGGSSGPGADASGVPAAPPAIHDELPEDGGAIGAAPAVSSDQPVEQGDTDDGTPEA